MRLWEALVLAAASLIGGFTSAGAAGTDQSELQARCGKLAAEYFSTEYGNGIYNNDYVDPDTHKTLYDETRSGFVNHYNSEEDRCLTVVTRENITRFEKTENLVRWIMIIDLDARRVIGMLHQFNTTTDVCFIEHQDCRTVNEWELFLWSYMHD